MYMRHLFICHGTRHDIGSERMCTRIQVHFTIEDIRKGRVMTTDINPYAKPDLVWDFTTPMPPIRLKRLGKFDIISGWCCNYDVLHAGDGWKIGTFTNVSALLKNGGKCVTPVPKQILLNMCPPGAGYACVARSCRAFLKLNGLPLRLLTRREALRFLKSMYDVPMPLNDNTFIFEKLPASS